MLNIVQLEKDFEAKRQEGLALISRTAINAQGENRALTPEESAEIESNRTGVLELKAKIDRAKGHDAMRDELEKLTSGLSSRSNAAPVDRRSMGEQFVQSSEYEFFSKLQGHRTSAAWRSPSVELFDRFGMHATTLTTDPASGGDLIMPDQRGGILPLLFKRLTVAGLMASGTTDSNAINYMEETLFTNAAAPVLEGGVKPESAMGFDAKTDPVRKIAHWLPVTEEMLEDVAQIRSYIDARLRLGVDIAEEDQLLNGTGVAPQILGMLKRPGLKAAYVRVDPMTNAEALFVQMMSIYYSSFLMPTGFILNPINWAATVLMKTTTGEYMGGGPFSGVQTQTLWGLPVTVTPSVVANTGVVGAFKTATQVFRKGGIRVEASNSHQDFFIKNLVAIRAEERLALAVYRPQAIGTVTGLTGAPLSMAAEGEGGQGSLRGGSQGALGEGNGGDEATTSKTTRERAR